MQPHRDALILSLGIGDFDVRQILIDLGSSIDLLQVSIIKQMGIVLSSLENQGRILSGFNGTTTTSLGKVVIGPSRLSHPQRTILSGGRFILFQRHFGEHLVSLHEGHLFHVPLDGELPD